VIRKAVRLGVALPQFLLGAAAFVLFAVAAEFMGPCWPVNRKEEGESHES
jgi:hypothetical protein